MFVGRAISPDLDVHAVPLRWPHLADSRYKVVHGRNNGRNNELMNHYFGVRAQRYAIDIVEINRAGFRARSLWPKQLRAYHIWETEVMAPCAGEIVATEAELPDRIPPDADGEQPAGNYVAIHCLGVTVILAHLRQHSVAHAVSDEVVAGKLLGNIGNSGNTSEPHLHIHAVKGKVRNHDKLLWESEGVPIMFDARFLLRNDVHAARTGQLR